VSDAVEIKVPDLGGAEKVLVVEILVSAGSTVAVDDGLLTLESDKASMDIPSPQAGVIEEILVEVGDQVVEGQAIMSLVSQDAESAESPDERGAQSKVPLAPQEEGEAALEEPPTESSAVVTEPPEQSAPAPVASESPAKAPEDRSAGAVPDTSMKTEVLVLGGGPGGYTAAFRAADLGKKVTLVERHSKLGGVCLNVGCIPSKALLHVAKVMDETADLAKHGVSYGKPKVELDKVRGFKDSVVDRLTKGLAALAKQRNVEIVQGEAQFTSPNSLQVKTSAGETAISFEQAIIAAGSRVVSIPGIPWDDPRVIDSTGALALQDVPKRLLVIGGGIIGLEMAMVYGALGSKLTIVEMLDGLIPGCDRDLVKPLERRLKRRYKATIHLGTKVSDIKPLKSGLKATFEGGKEPAPETFDRVLVAVGRRPNGDRIGAEAAGVRVDDRGFIEVDKQQRTNVAQIFAVGDITGQPMLAHKATHEGKVAAEVAAGEKSAFDARVIPSVAYTDPEIAWVGLTETEAAERDIAYEKGSFPWSASGRSLGMGRSDGLTKILFDPATSRVIGGGIVGPTAGDLIAEIALAIEMDCEAADLALTIHPHPTLSESIAFAAEAYEGTITDLYVPRKK
jgi:dihydrolipoamide dehydrogenase